MTILVSAAIYLVGSGLFYLIEHHTGDLGWNDVIALNIGYWGCWLGVWTFGRWRRARHS